MPPLSDHSSIICCTSRQPPSPDGLSPRFAKSPRKYPTKSPQQLPDDAPKLHLSSVSSLDVAELQFMGIADDISEAKSTDYEPKPIGTTLEALDLETGDAPNPIKARLSLVSLNFKQVSKNLKKHLARDPALDKRRSRSSVGHSEEEIERRAELRRIRQKRIEEELSHESVYGDDEESSVAVTDDATKDQTPHALETQSSPESSKRPQLSLPVLSLPKLGLPRLAPLSREQALPPRNSEPITTISTKPADSNTIKRTSVGTISRRYSSPILTNFGLSFADPRTYVPCRKLSAIPPTPSTPNLKPQRLPSIPGPDKSSWRLSFASSNRGEQLRSLSREHGVPWALTSDGLSTRNLPARKWLHNQGLKSSSQHMESADTCLDMDASHSHDDVESQDFGGVDGPDDSTCTVTLYQTDVPTTLEPKSEPIRKSSPESSHSKGSGGVYADSSPVVAGGSELQSQSKSDSIPLSEPLPLSWESKKKEEDQPCLPSVQQSPKASRFGLISLVLGRKSKNELKEALKSLPASQFSTINPNVHTMDDATTSLAVPSTTYSRSSTLDDGSMLTSETESFREREAELKVVQARFADAQRTPGTPISSRFREEFDLHPPFAVRTEPRERKLSVLARIARRATRTFDGASAMEDLLAVPIPKFDIKETMGHTSGLMTPRADRDVSTQWGKAIKSTVDEKATDVSNHLEVSGRKGNHGSRARGSFSRMGYKKGDKVKKHEDEPLSAADQYKKQFEARLAVKEMAMDDWEAEMEANAKKAKAKSRNIMRKIKAPTGPDNRFPLSWSRFPSHDRQERSLSAGAPDQVAHHDFAMRLSESGESVFHQCRETDDGHIHDDDPDWHKHDPEEMGLAAKIADTISQKLYHLEVHGGGSKPFEFQTFGRRGSMVLADKLEFPELELLPISPGLHDETSEADDPIEKEMASKEKEKQSINRTTGSGTQAAQLDGTFDDSELENSVVSIADPRFYDDCLVLPTNKCVDSLLTATIGDVNTLRLGPRSKSMTWNEGGSSSHRLSRGRNLSVGAMNLRASTDDYCDEMARLEKAELEKLLRSTELVCGVFV